MVLIPSATLAEIVNEQPVSEPRMRSRLVSQISRLSLDRLQPIGLAATALENKAWCNTGSSIRHETHPLSMIFIGEVIGRARGVAFQVKRPRTPRPDHS